MAITLSVKNTELAQAVEAELLDKASIEQELNSITECSHEQREWR